MKLSACLVCFNEERWIDICIESMLPYVDEIICIDGGSTDSTINILKRYKKVKYYIIKQPPQRYKEYSEGERRNIINDLASGEWIIHMDCDELFEDSVWDHLNEWLSDETMQAIAEENNLAETAFYVPGKDGFHIRWFTPNKEVKLCGHATLASAFVLFNILGYESDAITFDSLSGPLSVTRANNILAQVNYVND